MSSRLSRIDDPIVQREDQIYFYLSLRYNSTCLCLCFPPHLPHDTADQPQMVRGHLRCHSGSSPCHCMRESEVHHTASTWRGFKISRMESLHHFRPGS